MGVSWARSMATRDHYVSRFFLSGFTDLSTPSGADPWLWVGRIPERDIRRRAPKNVAWSRGLFQGSGGLADREQRLEDFLAQQVEGPAAQALRRFVSASLGTVKEVPAELTRYLS